MGQMNERCLYILGDRFPIYLTRCVCEAKKPDWIGSDARLAGRRQLPFSLLVALEYDRERWKARLIRVLVDDRDASY